ncbi:MAG: 2-oxo acid dehydrogenase subunit E2 [Gemmatimonadetes bacterium]|nr:2-oxo acid dehydrogenase subunit E2 [Gemmatimonadota bacterium]
MATRIVMAKLSPTMEEGRILRWMKQEGEPVQMGEPVVEVETDKANMEVQAMGAGALRKILVAEGETVPTGALLGVVAEPDEDIEAILSEAGAGSAGAAEAGVAGPPKPAPREGAAARAGGADSKPAAGAGVGAAGAPQAAPAAPTATAVAEPAAPPAAPSRKARPRASPLARRLAAESGLEVAAIAGTGPGGRVVKRDIEAALRESAEVAGAEPPYERVELTQIRKTIARRMPESLGPIPHYYLTTEVDMERALMLREELNAEEDESGVRISVNDILVKVAAQALVLHPEVNVGFAGDHIRRYTRADIGIAVALDDGLITPVLRNAQAKGLRQIAEESRVLIERARARRLTPEEYSNATFTISNLGMFEIDEFTAVINPPGATILAVGAVREKPVVVEGEIEVRKRMRVTLSCDHRVVDGATGARFLQTFRKMLENPLYLAF